MSEQSANSEHAQAIQVFKEDDLMAECHVSFDKLLSSLFQFRASKNSNMIRSMAISQTDSQPNTMRRTQTMQL